MFSDQLSPDDIKFQRLMFRTLVDDRLSNEFAMMNYQEAIYELVADCVTHEAFDLPDLLAFALERGYDTEDITDYLIVMNAWSVMNTEREI